MTATAAVLTVTAVNYSSHSHVTVWPTGEGMPIASNLNLVPGASNANMVTVKLAQRLAGDGVIVIALHPGHLRTAMGGAAAPMEPAEAAESVAAMIADLTPADSGTFRRWDGSTHPW